MTTVSILPVPDDQGGFVFQAVAGASSGCGATPGKALDAISLQLDETETSTLVLLQNHRPDRFFTSQQRDRLAELMASWRAARDAGEALCTEEQEELDALVQMELRAAGQRANAMADELIK